MTRFGSGIAGVLLAGALLAPISANAESKERTLRFAFQNAGVDCVTVGYKAPAEIDEAIENLNLALA